MRSKQMKALAKEECEMQMTPMIDVVFLLLIFFMCTLKFKTLEGKLSAYLPKDVGVNTFEAEPVEKVEIKLTVKHPGKKMSARNPRLEWDGDGRFEYVGRVIQYQIGPKRTEDIEVLADRLKEIFKADETRPATIDSRKGTVYGDVVAVLDAAILAGYTQITFVGEYK